MNGPDDPQEPPIQPPQPPYAPYEQPPEPPSRASRARITATIVVVLALLAGGGAALVLRATNAEQSVDKFAPDSVAAFVKISLKPSSSQRDAVRSLISKFPSEVQSKIQPKLDDALDGMFKDVGLSYTKDVKPWIGGQFGIAIQPPGGSTSDSPDAVPTITGLLPVRDASAARVALDKVHKADPKTFYKIFGSMLYLGDSEKQIDDFRASVTQGHTLADNATYKAEYARSGADSLVFAYLNVKKIGGLVPTLPGDVLGGSKTGPQFDTVFVSLKATSTGLSLVGRGHVNDASKIKTFKPELLESTGSDLIGALSVFNIGEGFESFLKAIEQFGFGGLALPVSARSDPVTEGLHQFEQLLGLDLKKDVFPWMRGEVSVVIGTVTNPPIPNIGILIRPTDDKALDRTLAALRAHLPPLLQGLGGRLTTQSDGFTVEIPNGPPPIVVKRATDRLVIATGSDYADELMNPSGTTLADDTVYKSVIGTNNKVGGELFLRLDRLRPLIEGFAKLGDPNGYADYERNVQPFLKPLQALGFTVSLDGNDLEARLTVSVNS